MFYDTQDPQIKNLQIHRAQTMGDKATVSATFTNSGVKGRIIYVLVQKNDAWRIADIKYGNGESLLNYFGETANKKYPMSGRATCALLVLAKKGDETNFVALLFSVNLF